MNDRNLFFKYAHPEYYYKYFSTKVRQKGKDYFFDDKVIYYEKVSDYNYKAKVRDLKVYEVKLKINPNNIKEIENMSCTCKFYQNNKVGCKHIYAVLLKSLVAYEKSREATASLSDKVDDMNRKLDRAIELAENKEYKTYNSKSKRSKGILDAFIDSFSDTFLKPNNYEDTNHLYDYEKKAMKNYGYGKDDFEEEELEDDDYYFDDDREK